MESTSDVRGRGRWRRRRARLQGEDRGQVLGRRIRHRRAVGQGVDRPRSLAARQQVRDPGGRRAAAPAVRRAGHQVLRREGRSQEGQVREGHGDAVAAAVPLRQPRVLAADPAGARELERRAGSDRQHPRAEQHPLRGRELPQRHHPDEPDRQRRRAHAVRRVLRRAVRPHPEAGPERGGHRVLVGRRAAAIRAPARPSIRTTSRRSAAT